MPAVQCLCKTCRPTKSMDSIENLRVPSDPCNPRYAMLVQQNTMPVQQNTMPVNTTWCLRNAMQCNACRAIPMHQNMIPVILLLANRTTSTRHRSRGGKPAKTQSLPRNSSDDPKSFHGAPQMNQRPNIIWWDTERS